MSAENKPFPEGEEGGCGNIRFCSGTGALRGHRGWEKQWNSPEPRAEYDVVIIGGGGHGLGAAYYLAKEHGITMWQ